MNQNRHMQGDYGMPCVMFLSTWANVYGMSAAKLSLVQRLCCVLGLSAGHCQLPNAALRMTQYVVPFLRHSWL